MGFQKLPESVQLSFHLCQSCGTWGTSDGTWPSHGLSGRCSQQHGALRGTRVAGPPCLAPLALVKSEQPGVVW